MSIKKGQFACSIFGSMYTFSPYMGCSHNCLYCDGRAEKYHLKGNFATDIKVKEGIVEELETTLPKLRENAPFHLSSGISDVYQAKEKTLNITGRCSEILSKERFHASVLTKSALILRDFDNWSKLKGGFTLQMSLTTLDDKIRRRMESGASPVEARLETIKAFKDAGCNVGIYMMPLLPELTDTHANITPLLERLRDLEVDYIMPGPLSLRPGRQKEIYIDAIDHFYPELSSNYMGIYRENRLSGMPTKRFQEQFNHKIEQTMTGINTLPPHYLYRNTMPKYCELIILLSHMLQLYKWKGYNVDKLKYGEKRIRDYLTLEKKRFNKKRSLEPDHIDKNLVFLLETDSFNNIIDNPKLIEFIKQVILGRKIFNYQSLTLE